MPLAVAMLEMLFPSAFANLFTQQDTSILGLIPYFAGLMGAALLPIMSAVVTTAYAMNVAAASRRLLRARGQPAA